MKNGKFIYIEVSGVICFHPSNVLPYFIQANLWNSHLLHALHRQELCQPAATPLFNTKYC